MKSAQGCSTWRTKICGVVECSFDLHVSTDLEDPKVEVDEGYEEDHGDDDQCKCDGAYDWLNPGEEEE